MDKRKQETKTPVKESVVSAIVIILIIIIVIILAVVNNNMNKSKQETIAGKDITNVNTAKTGYSKEETEKIEKANSDIEITPEILKEKLEKNENMIIDFHATWCEPCKLMKPEIAKALEQGVKIYKIDVDKYKNTAIEYGIRVMPTAILIKDKKTYKSVYGFQNSEKLKALYNEIK